MSKGNTKSSSGGVGFLSLLTIAFIVLKLTGHIDWSWFWVLSPMIFSGLLIFVSLIIVGILAWNKD
jgi:hypothetical protein